MKIVKLLDSIRQLLTLSGLPLKGALNDQQLEVIENAGIMIPNDRIFVIGEYGVLLEAHKDQNIKKVEVNHPMIALPSWVDCHTHLCFASSRATDFTMRNSGKSYLEIALAGVGIWDTVKATRAMPIAELKKITVDRGAHHLRSGVTTIEVKSGYGLTMSQELKMLSAIQMLKTPANLIPTCLAAHSLPKDFEGTKAAYLATIQAKLFPMLKAHKLEQSNRCFCGAKCI